MNILENNSIFWSRLGFELDPPQFDKNGKLIEFGGDYQLFARYHKDMHKAGVKLHTSILHSGWVGPERYDYTFTDRTLDALFEALPEDALYIPRVKLNAPVEWSKQNPEELFVYYDGNNEPEYIRPRVGSLEHDLLGYEAPNGYYMGRNNRPNVNGTFSNQSFASKKWLKDASKALVALMRHVAEKPYAKRIIGWHLAYGVSGETCLWGRFGRNYGDYSLVFQKAFQRWGEHKYGSPEALLNAWKTLEMPSPAMRKEVYDSVAAFKRERECDVIVRDLDEFMSELNSSVAEHFCKVAKEENPEALTGIFYGYMLECHNAAYTGWLGLERILNSPYVDFLAAPTSYYRRDAGESGGFIAPAQSIRLRKYWVDELDIRTYLMKGKDAIVSIPEECTEAVFHREISKNLSADTGYWWMDLGGGWFDSAKILNLIRDLEGKAQVIRKRKHRSVADILLVVDDKSMRMHTESSHLFRLLRDFRREAALAGGIIDTYRLSDLPQLELSQYKLIVFCDCIEIPYDFKEQCVLYSYLDQLPDGLSVKEVKGGFPEQDVCFEGIFSGKMHFDETPLPRVVPLCRENIKIHARFSDNTPAVVSNGKKIYSVLPFLKAKQFRQLLDFAGCKTYGSVPCTVYGDSRFTAWFSHDEPARFHFEIHQ